MAFVPRCHCRRNILYLYLAQDPNVTCLLPTDSRAAFEPEGYLLFVQQGSLMAQQLDTEKLELSGSAFPVAENVRANVNNGRVESSRVFDREQRNAGLSRGRDSRRRRPGQRILIASHLSL